MIKRGARVKPRASRPARILTPGLNGRIGDVDCSVGNLSPTGALLLTRHEIPLETSWPLCLQLPSGDVHVTCRIVRCESIEIQMPGAVWRRKDSAIGVLFDGASPAANQAIRSFCHTTVAMEESAPRVLVIGSDTELSKVISSTLADADYVPRVITNAREATSVARRIGAKVAVVNLEDGRILLDTVDALRASPVAGDIPIVACVAFSKLPERQRQHLGEQRVRLLALPLTPEELVETVDRAALGRVKA